MKAAMEDVFALNIGYSALLTTFYALFWLHLSRTNGNWSLSNAVKAK